MNIKEMLARQQAIVNGAKGEGRGLTDDEQKEFERLQGEIDAARQLEAGEQRSVDTNELTRQAIADERQRMSDVVDICRQTGMEPDEYIKDGVPVDDVRKFAVDFLVKNGSPVSSRNEIDEGDSFRSAAIDSLIMRAGVDIDKPAEGASEMRSMSLRDIAIMSMSRDGLGSEASMLRMSKDDLWGMACRQFYNPTAAFPAILDNAIRKSIVQLYQKIPTTFQLWTSKGSLSDFKSTKDHNYLFGGVGDFLLVPESGELKHDTPRTELLPQRKLETYGRQFSMTRQAFINDDIGFITEVPGAYAISAKKTINKQVYSILVNNPAIYDGVKLFDAAHKNLAASASAPSNSALQKIIMGMLRQTDPFGDPIMVQPGFLIVPVGYKFLLTSIFQSPTINTPENTQAVNPLYQYRDQLQTVEEGLINGFAGDGAIPWFMAADKAYAKNIQVDYLNGQETPTVRRMETAGQLGFVWDIFLDWGVSVMDYRGLARNNGVVIED